jgi:hypothetical protein
MRSMIRSGGCNIWYIPRRGSGGADTPPKFACWVETPTAFETTTLTTDAWVPLVSLTSLPSANMASGMTHSGNCSATNGSTEITRDIVLSLAAVSTSTTTELPADVTLGRWDGSAFVPITGVTVHTVSFRRRDVASTAPAMNHSLLFAASPVLSGDIIRPIVRRTSGSLDLRTYQSVMVI